MRQPSVKHKIPQSHCADCHVLGAANAEQMLANHGEPRRVGGDKAGYIITRCFLLLTLQICGAAVHCLSLKGAGGLHARIPAPSIVLLCVSRESELSGGGGASCQGYQKPESVPG